MQAFLEDLRRVEIEDLRGFFGRGQRVLEVGGADGFQASILSNWGLKVNSIDVADRPRSGAAHFPVQDYEGRRLPFPDASFDRVFSSNLLEHVKDLAGLLSEMGRVLRPDGMMIHVLPSSTWRFWTSVTYYPHVVRLLMTSQRRHDTPRLARPLNEQTTTSERLRSICRRLVAGPHGEYPSAISELYYFSRGRWTRVLQDAGFQIAGVEPTSLFYTGYATSQLTMESRRRLAGFLGAAGTVFILRKTLT